MRALPVITTAICLIACGHAVAQTPTAPAQASAAGFSTLVFDDEFLVDSFTAAAATRVWWDTFWFFPPPVGTAVLLPAENAVRLTEPGTSPYTHLVNHPVNTAPYGPDYIFGYFEARMRFSAGPGGDVKNSWGAFWLFSKAAIENRVTDPNGNKAWCELDVAEMFGHGLLNTTIHSWYQPNGGTPQDTYNPVHLSLVPNDPLDGNWHTFGVLWQYGVVTWYMDDVQVTSYAHSYDVCNTQPMTPVLSVQTLTNDIQIADVDWVRVWK